MPSVSSQHCSDGVVAALGQDVGGAELEGDLLAGGVAAQSDDPLSAEPLRRENGGEADGAVAHDRDRVPLFHTAAHGGVVARAHHIRQREQGAQRLVGMVRG